MKPWTIVILVVALLAASVLASGGIYTTTTQLEGRLIYRTNRITGGVQVCYFGSKGWVCRPVN